MYSRLLSVRWLELESVTSYRSEVNETRTLHYRIMLSQGVLSWGGIKFSRPYFNRLVDKRITRDRRVIGHIYCDNPFLRDQKTIESLKLKTVNT